MDADLRDKLDTVFSAFEGAKHELIPVLQQVQEALGYLPSEAMEAIARFLGVAESRVFAVATFYAQFRFAPIGRTRVMVCRGTACHVRGAPRILDALKDHFGIDEGETTEDRAYTLETVACIGACGLSPCIMVGKKVEAKLTPQKVTDIFAKGEEA